MSYHVTGLSAGQEYFFFIMANTSVGGTESTVVSASIPVERIEPSKYPCKENSLLSEPEVINRDESRGNKNAKKRRPMLSHVDLTSLVDKGFIIFASSCPLAYSSI